MARMREAKKKLKQVLQSPNWRSHIPDIARSGITNVGALFSFLLLEPVIRHRAAVALGATTAAIAVQDPEAGRNIIRRFMWHLSEESGNIGWGIPEAFGESLAASPILANTYYKILVSRIIDLGFDDNYCDNDQLRRSCYWSIGRLASARPDLAEYARKWLIKGLTDKDGICRGMAAWALAQLPPSLAEAPALRALASAGDENECEIFENDELRLATASVLAHEALERIKVKGPRQAKDCHDE